MNSGQVINIDNESWDSFFEPLKLEKGDMLPPFIKRVSPQGYWEDRELGKRIKRIAIRNAGTT